MDENEIGVLAEMMADKFPEEYAKVDSILQHFDYSDEVIRETFRRMIIGAMTQTLRNEGIALPSYATQEACEKYLGHSRESIRSCLRSCLEEKGILVNFARLTENFNQSELYEIIKARTGRRLQQMKETKFQRFWRYLRKFF